MPQPPGLHRQVFFLGGFDPKSPRQYHRLYRRAVKARPKQGEEQVVVSAREDDGELLAGWQVRWQGPGTGGPLVTDYRVMRWDDLVRRHWVRGGLQVLMAERVRANADQARALQVPARSALLHLQILGEGGGQPLHVSDRYFPLPRFDGLEDVVRETGSITAGFAAHGVTDYVRHESRISARLPGAETAALMRQPVTRPVLLVTTVNTDPEDRPIELAETWFAGDRVTLTVNHDG
eukprot:gene49550-66377_t